MPALTLSVLRSVGLGLGYSVSLRSKSTRNFGSSRLWSGRSFSEAVNRGQWGGDLHKLEVFDRFYLRRSLRIRWQHFISNTVVRSHSLQNCLFPTSSAHESSSLVLPYSSSITGRLLRTLHDDKVVGSGVVDS